VAAVLRLKLQQRVIVGGSVTTVTNLAWFFAAARIIAGPPMSMFSMQVA
jgi:hypothetical protein